MRRASEFLSPVPLAAVALLAANDHVFKGAFHNAITGKVSDFAGCFFLPLYVSAVLAYLTRWPLQRRLLIGAAATVALFVPIKLWGGAAAAVARAMDVLAVPAGIGPSRIIADPTDLIAVPMVFLAVLYAERMNARCAASPS